MKKIILSGLVTGIVLLVISILGLYVTIWLFPKIAEQYFDPAFATRSGKAMIYYIHPFVISLALSWFWSRFKGVLTGSFLTRGIEFGLIYVLVAAFPMLLLVYGAMSVTVEIVITWFLFALIQGVVAGLVFEKMNP